MKWICFFFFLLAHTLYAQKIVKKSFINPKIEAIILNVTNSFELFVDTAPGNEVLVEAAIDGEYCNDLLVNVKTSGNTLFIDTEFQPNFKKPNDKLSAHKVISIALKLLLPEQKRVTIFGTGCHVTAKGSYEKLKITLSDGSCHLKSISGTAVVATQSGTISVLARNAKIKATSKYGRVGRNQIPSGDTFYDVSSVTGDILLDKIE
ncbi:hypothetical protein SAMN05421636_101342 [Pricia antarctica]|uniref:Adhesin domain-containing protein n=1 Tax=Pricia antarctica TaxID=641691 RepID=A0A1G6WKC8_9FLAO|nr:DUF4097 family beta strand repeat-containing protein [Pricia antarctica]SDD66143.1 hypothetical protein SAMN05421636_101342 [Pricia antarctica]